MAGPSAAHDMSPPVVVGGGLNALGVVRSLARGGQPSVLLAPAGGETPAAHSRYPRVHRYHDDGPNAVVEALVRIADRPASPKPLLILTEEEKVTAVSAARQQLAERYELLLPSAEVVTTLLDKNGFAGEAATQNARVPKSVAVREGADLGQLDALAPPLVIKPAGRQAAYLSRYPRAERADSVAAARAMLVERLAVSRGLIVQEWIDGADDAIYFCLQFLPPDGQAPVSFTGRKLRIWPPATGGTARCIAAPEAAASLIPMTTAFFQAAGVVGFASMEYKRRADSHDYVMVEPTIGRTDHQEEIATLNGTNLPVAAVHWAQDKPLRSTRAMSRPRIWRDPIGDAHAAAARAAGEAMPRARVVDALWRSGDPGPWFVDMKGRLQRRLRRGQSV